MMKYEQEEAQIPHTLESAVKQLPLPAAVKMVEGNSGTAWLEGFRVNRFAGSKLLNCWRLQTKLAGDSLVTVYVRHDGYVVVLDVQPYETA